MPKVSVIIPTHNRADMLQEAIASVVAQSYKDWEIIVIDDHSTDSTTSVVKSFHDERIRYIINIGNSGPSISRNLGISYAASEYIAFLDDDDEWLPHKLQKQIKILEKSSQKICGIYSNRWIIDKKSGKIISVIDDDSDLRGNLLLKLLKENKIHTSTVIVKKKYLDKIGEFDDSMRFMEDRDMWIRLSINWDFEYIHEPLICAYYYSDDHLSRNMEGKTIGMEIFLKKYLYLLKKSKENLSNLYLNLGAHYLQMGKMRKGKINIMRSIRINPFNIFAIFHIIASLLGHKKYNQIRNFYKNYQLIE